MHGADFLEMEAEIFAVITAIIVLAVQLVLCFKVRNRWIRLLPACLCVIAAAASLALTYFHDGWGGVAYMLLMIFCVCLLLVCGIGWLAWAIIKKLRR